MLININNKYFLYIYNYEIKEFHFLKKKYKNIFINENEEKLNIKHNFYKISTLNNYIRIKFIYTSIVRNQVYNY